VTKIKEFWSLNLLVTTDTLIPRPETELLVELALKKLPLEHAMLADLGTGSGAIALAIANERPKWRIHATDISSPALQLAQLNAEHLELTNHLTWHQGNWCQALGFKLLEQFDAIISNPPYIAPRDPHLRQAELHFEPKIALIAEDNGLRDLQIIIITAKNYLRCGGYLLLEHGHTQAQAVQNLLQKNNYDGIETWQDLAGLDRVTLGIKPLPKLR